MDDGDLPKGEEGGSESEEQNSDSDSDEPEINSEWDNPNTEYTPLKGQETETAKGPILEPVVLRDKVSDGKITIKPVNKQSRRAIRMTREDYRYSVMPRRRKNNSRKT